MLGVRTNKSALATIEERAVSTTILYPISPDGPVEMDRMAFSYYINNNGVERELRFLRKPADSESCRAWICFYPLGDESWVGYFQSATSTTGVIGVVVIDPLKILAERVLVVYQDHESIKTLDETITAFTPMAELAQLYTFDGNGQTAFRRFDTNKISYWGCDVRNGSEHALTKEQFDTIRQRSDASAVRAFYWK